MKKISILLTSYNLEEYIDTSIRSVVQQDMPCEWELLIGDDGSTDRTVEHIKKWIDKYPNNIRLFTIPRENETQKIGSRAAKNRAFLLKQSSGDYINFLDGDDCWLGADKLIKQFEKLESSEYINCSCCAHNIEAYVIPENRRYLLTDKSIKNRVYSFKDYWKETYFHTNTILFRSVCKEKLLHPLYERFLNDNFITFLLLQYGDILFLNEVWSQYNMTGNGLWTGHKKIYGLFRNLQIIDLQLLERPDCRSLIYYRHFNDLKNILTTYSYDTDYQIVKSLIEPMDYNVFHLLFLLSKAKQLTVEDKKDLCKLKRDLRLIYYQKLMNRVIKKIACIFCK